MEIHKFLLEYLPMQQLSLINGKLLGDGSLTIEKSRKPRFRFQHCQKDKDWCQHCYDLLKGYLPLNAPKYKKITDTRLIQGYSESFYVQSRTSDVFTLLKEVWYNGNIKVVPVDLISKTLNSESLAWWYQDDGHLVIQENTPRKIILSTDNFNREENLILIELLREKFHLRFSLDSQNRLCLYNQPEIFIFLNIINPHIHSSMTRKMIHATNNSQPILTANNKRTTIYLPSSIKIRTPTREIREAIFSIKEENFINDWFHSWDRASFKIDDKLFRSYQIILQKAELEKILFIQQKTGLRMSEIITLCFLTKRGLSNGQTS